MTLPVTSKILVNEPLRKLHGDVAIPETFYFSTKELTGFSEVKKLTCLRVNSS